MRIDLPPHEHVTLIELSALTIAPTDTMIRCVNLFILVNL